VEQVGAEPADAAGEGDVEGAVHVLAGLEAGEGLGRAQRQQQGVRLVAAERRPRQLGQVAVDAKHRRVAGDQVQVGGAGLDRPAEPAEEDFGDRPRPGVRVAHAVALAPADAARAGLGRSLRRRPAGGQRRGAIRRCRAGC
jgi:hypothetical protein